MSAVDIDQQRVLHGQSQGRNRLRLILTWNKLKLELGRDHHNNRQSLKSSKRLTKTDTRTSIEARELEGRLFADLRPGMILCIRMCVVLQGTLLDLGIAILEPTLGQELGCLRAPDLLVTTDGIGREHDAISTLNLSTTGEDVVSNRGLEVTGDWRVKTKGLEEDGVGVPHILGQHLVGGSLVQLVHLLPDVLLYRRVLHHLVVHPAECLSSCVTSSTVAKRIEERMA